jgi:hypothetical protein
VDLADGDNETKTIQVPFPDPTERTLEQSRREIVQLKELLEADLDAVRAQGDMRYGLARELLDTRLSDHANLTTERFESIRRETQLALSAAQTAVDKAEQSTTKTLDALQVGIAAQIASVTVAHESQIKTLEEQITSLKERVDRSEGKGAGIATSWGVIVAAVGAVGVLVSIVVVVMNLITTTG